MIKSNKIFTFVIIGLLIFAVFAIFEFEIHKQAKQKLKFIFIKPNIEIESAASNYAELQKNELDDFRKMLEERNTKAFLLIKDDKIIYEWYKNALTQ